MIGARRRGRPLTARMDSIKTWTGLSVEESIRMTEDRDKWSTYVMVWPTLGSRTAKEQNGVNGRIGIGLHVEGSGHKGSKTNYFRFGHFYTPRKVSTRLTRWCYAFSDWPFHFRAIISAKRLPTSLQCVKMYGKHLPVKSFNPQKANLKCRNSHCYIFSTLPTLCRVH